MEQRLLSIGAVAEKLDVSPRAVSKWAAAGRLPAPVRIGRTVRWRASDIDRFMALGCPDDARPESGGQSEPAR